MGFRKIFARFWRPGMCFEVVLSYFKRGAHVKDTFVRGETLGCFCLGVSMTRRSVSCAKIRSNFNRPPSLGQSLLLSYSKNHLQSASSLGFER